MNCPQNLLSAPPRDGTHECSLDATTYAKLDAFARLRGISIEVALRQLIEVGAGSLEEETALLEGISPKQQQVLKSLRAGLSVKEIAGRLGVTENSVRTHIHRIRGSLDRSDLLSLRFH